MTEERNSLPPADGVPASTLKLLVKGFDGMESRLLDATVKLSQRRTPALALLPDEQASDADVIMIDGRNEKAMFWAVQQQAWLASRTVIWVDTRSVPVGHTALRRPVQWANLPIVLSRALDDSSTQQYLNANQGAAQAQAQAATPAATAQAPQRASVPTPAPQQAAAPAPALSSMAASVLVVDDSRSVRVHLRTALEAHGYRVTDVESGEDALETLAAGHFQCVLMDVLMPGMDGYEACRRIKARAQRGQSTPVVMLTSRASPFDKIRGKMAGCDAYLTKPVTKSQLFDVLARYTTASKAAAGAQQHTGFAQRPLGMPA